MKFTVRFHDHIIISFKRVIDMIGFPKTVIEIGCFEGESTLLEAFELPGGYQTAIRKL